MTRMTYELISHPVSVGDYIKRNPELLEVAIRGVRVVFVEEMDGRFDCSQLPDATTVGQYIAMFPEILNKTIKCLEVSFFDNDMIVVAGHRVITHSHHTNVS